MKNLWVRFGCFLTGYNYGIVTRSSEVAVKAVKRYTSAILIACILWSFIGYTFTHRYLHGGTFGSFAGAAIMVTIVIQIERQIILSVTRSNWLYLFRGLIACMMAIIGAIIIDQIIFKEDIELEQITFIEEKIKKALPPRTEELRNQIAALDTAIQMKELERLKLIEAVNRNPVIKTSSSQSQPTTIKTSSRDSSGRFFTSEKVVNTTSVSVTNVPNPKQSLIAPLEQTIAELRKQKNEKDIAILNIRPQLENEIKSKVGFLDELKVMYALIKDSNIALVVWFIWFFFLLGLEMLVVISKATERTNDYDDTVLHHMRIQRRKLELLSAPPS